MLFNSLAFLLFFPAVVGLFFALPQRLRWAFLLLASYGFYMCWRPAYLGLILLVTATCYLAAAWMSATANPTWRRVALVTNLGVCLGVLFLFKYLGFATATLGWAAQALGASVELPRWQLVLPVGVSFYTFQALSYSLDVYWGRLPHERHFGIFAFYVAFFPQLVAGPIERAGNLLPQFREQMEFDYERVVSGLRWMLWGMFKKVVVADNLAPFVNTVYGNPTGFTGGALAWATLLFSFQIYCDFSGYSDIAVGAARVMGFRLMSNFETPYFSRSVSEFWRRWHISLSTWFRDYLYIPLGGNRGGAGKTVRNYLVVFLLCGLWHGASWVFVVWGGFHGSLVAAEYGMRRWFRRHGQGRVGRLLQEGWLFGLGRRALVFATVTLGWVFFRSSSLPEAWMILGRIGHFLLGIPGLIVQPDPRALARAVFVGQHSRADLAVVLYGLGGLVLGDLLLASPRWRGTFRTAPHRVHMAVYTVVVLSILLLGALADESPFLYFQF